MSPVQLSEGMCGGRSGQLGGVSLMTSHKEAPCEKPRKENH